MRALDALPTRPWDSDVRIWRNGDAAEPCGASVPWTVIWHSPDGWNFGYGGCAAIAACARRSPLGTTKHSSASSSQHWSHQVAH